MELSKSFDFAQEITVLAMQKYGKVSLSRATADDITEFFERIYVKLKEIEDKEKKMAE